MRIALALLLLVGTSSVAHAMGADVSYRLVAWNKTGTAALLENTSSNGDDTFRSYVVLSTTGSSQSNEEVSGTVSWAGHDDNLKPVEQVTVDKCELTASALAIELREQHFNSVVVRVDRCSSPKRDIVKAAGAKQPGLPRTKATRAAEQLVIPGYKEPPHPNDCKEADTKLAVVASPTNKLLLVFETNLCDSPMRTSAHAIIPNGGEFKVGEIAI